MPPLSEQPNMTLAAKSAHGLATGDAPRSIIQLNISKTATGTDVLPLTAARHLRTRLLEGLSPEERNSILSSALHFRFKENSVPTWQGDPADRMFLLINGSARYFFLTPDGRKVYILWLTPGEIFGGACLVSQPSAFIVSTEVAKGAEVLVWERQTIRTLSQRFPRLMENVLSIACDYLVWNVASHLGLICHSARQRLAHVLVSLASGFGQKRPDGIRIEVTNEQLANTANITLFTASRLLSEWHRKGILSKKRGEIVLRNPEELFHSPSRADGHGARFRRDDRA